jgi:hypothetical protein
MDGCVAEANLRRLTTANVAERGDGELSKYPPSGASQGAREIPVAATLPITAADMNWARYLDVTPEEVPDVAHALTLIPVYQAFRNLVGQSPEDLVVRAAALHGIQGTGKPALTRLDLDGALYYLTETRRENVLENLREGGWLEHSEDGWRLTPLGIDLYNIVLLLFELGKHPYMAFSTLLFHVIKDLQGNPRLSLQGLINQMAAMTESIHDKLEMRSSVALENEARRAASAVKMARVALREADELVKDASQAALVQRLHHELAHLLNANQRLTEALATVTAAHVSLPAGYTPHDIIVSLNRCDPERLAEVGREAHLCVLGRRLDVNEESLIAAAQGFLDRDRFIVDNDIPAEQQPETGQPVVLQASPELEVLARLIEEYPDEEVPVLHLLRGEPHIVLHRFFALDYLEHPDSDTPLARLKATLERGPDVITGTGVRTVTNLKIRKAHA